MPRSFFLWYYREGSRLACLSWYNLLRYVPYRFHLAGLFFSLFSPWKRDISPRFWRGLHPLLSLQRAAENLITRLLGGIVRLAVILLGVTLWIAALPLGALLLAAFLLAPLLLLGGAVLWLVFGSLSLGAGLLALGLLGLWLAAVYYDRDQPLWRGERLDAFRNHPILKRVWARLDLPETGRTKEVLESPERLQALLEEKNLSVTLFREILTLELTRETARLRSRRFWEWENLAKATPLGKTWQYGYTRHLDEYSADLSLGDGSVYGESELIGRQEELRIATVILERPEENSVVLVGDPGIGKKTLIHFLARRIRENAYTGTPLHDSRILVFDLGRTLGDARARGEDAGHWLRYLFAEATLAGNVILVIDDLDRYLGKEGQEDLSPVFNEFLRYPNFRVIATATTGGYHLLMKQSEESLRFFEAIYLREPNREQTLAILLDEFAPLERQRIVFTYPGFLAIAEAAERLHWETPFPERAIRLANEVLSYWKSEAQSPLITQGVVNAFVSLKTGMPVGELGSEEKEKLLTLESALHARVVGQEEAIRSVAEAMRRARAGLGSREKPIGSFLFLGPTGVGKTETAKAFAESYFGSDERMIRLDMSEYQGEGAVERLIGSESRGTSGELTRAVEEKPFSLVLLDEVEKAYPKALDLFLQILEKLTQPGIHHCPMEHKY